MARSSRLRSFSASASAAAARLSAVALCAAAALPSPAATGPRDDSPRSAERVEMSPRVSEIELDLSFDPETGILLVLAELRVEGNGVRSLEFGINPGLIVETSTADSGTVEHRNAGAGTFRVLLDPPIDGERRLRFRIGGRGRNGASLLAGPDRLLAGPRDRWYPVHPNTWAIATVRAKLPPGWEAVALGSPRGTGAGSVRVWKTRRPVRSLAVVAAPGLASGEGTAAGVPVRMAARDAPDLTAVAACLEGGTAWFAANFAPYPFDGLNLVALPGLSRSVRASGMLILPAARTLDNPADCADLLAGQWFGERVAGDGPWIESFAAWAATRFARDRALGLPPEIARLRDAYFDLSPGGDVPIARADESTPQEVLRGKGSAAPEMIRLTVGERAVEEALRDLFAGPVTPPVSLERIREIYEKHAGTDLGRVFADWFERRGAPRFETTLRTMTSASGGWRVDLTLRQKSGSYALPVEVRFLGPMDRHTETVRVEDETTSVYYDLPFRPARIVIDPLDRLFLRKSE